MAVSSYSPSMMVEQGVALERHFSPEQLGDIWGLSADTIRRVFEGEPGVLIIEHARTSARRYRTLRIPESVALRVHRRMSNSLNLVKRRA